MMKHATLIFVLACSPMMAMAQNAQAPGTPKGDSQGDRPVTVTGCLVREAPAPRTDAIQKEAGSERFGYVLSQARITSPPPAPSTEGATGASAAAAPAQMRVLPHGTLEGGALQSHVNQRVEVQGVLTMLPPNVDLSRNSSLTGTTSTSSTPASGTASGGTEPPQRPGTKGATGTGSTVRSSGAEATGETGAGAAAGQQNAVMPILRATSIKAASTSTSPASAPCGGTD